FVQTPGEGLLSKEYAKERAKLIDPKRASTTFQAGNPLPYDSKVKEWKYWTANIAGSTASASAVNIAQATLSSPNREGGASVLEGIVKDTTHISIIDKDGNIFDSTPSGGWVPGAVILGNTGIGMSIRGEQFWLDEDRAAQLRPRARPRYTLTPSIILKDSQPFMALDTPGGDNQDQTILQAFLDVVEFWPAWYPNLHEAFEWPRAQTLHFFASFWPHATGFNQLNLESTISDAVFQDLKSRGHNVSKIPPFSMSGCATAVLLDPASGNRIAGADPRRDCYAMAY